MKPLLHDLFHRHIGMAFDRQLRFADLFEERGIGPGWNYSVATAELTFGGTWTIPAPMLGSHAEHDNSWLWAWANGHLKLPVVGKRFASRVKKLADEPGGAIFAAEGVVSCEELFGEEVAEHAAHAMASVVSRLFNYDAYYTIPYTGGCAAAVFKEKQLRRMPDHPLIVMNSRFTQLISAFPIPDHRLAFLGYAADYGLTATVGGQSVRAMLPRVGELNAKFDRKNRLTKLESQTGPTKPLGSKGPPNPRPKPKPRPK